MGYPGSTEPALGKWRWRSPGTLPGLIRISRAKQKGWIGSLQPTPDIKPEGGKKGRVRLKGGGWRGKRGEVRKVRLRPKVGMS